MEEYEVIIDSVFINKLVEDQLSSTCCGDDDGYYVGPDCVAEFD